MPSLSPTMMEGKIVKWLKQEGDKIEPGDVICDIETDKAVVSFEVDEEGVLAKILVDQTSDTIKIGTMIAVMAPEGEDWKSIDIPADAGASETSSTAAAPVAAAAVGAPVSGVVDGRKYGPSVRLLLEQYGIAAAQVGGSGPHRELLKGDVLKFIQQGALAKVPQKAASPSAPAARPPAAVAPPPPSPSSGFGQSPYTDLEVSGVRRTIAKRLLQSKSGIAHSYGTIECRIDALLALRKQFKKDKIAVSVNDLIVKAVAVALQACPNLNCVWQGDQLVVSPTIDISVAVATPAGLITPIIRDADRLGVKAISDTIREMAGRAKDMKLRPEEFQGGSFTISNLGMFGVSEFSAIINPPQCGILAVGGSRAVMGVDGPETRMRATLSYDRLAVDDDSAERFLATVTGVLEQPSTLILGGVAPPPLSQDHPMAQLL